MHNKNNIYVFIAIFILIISQSCIRFSAIYQPDTAEPNSHFDVNITLNISCDSTGNNEAVYFGILIPNGWTVRDSIFYYGVYDGIFTYSPEYTDSMNNYFFAKPAEGYYWWIAVASEPLNPFDRVDTGTVSLSPRIFTDNQTGQFFISYTVSTDLSFFHALGYDYDHPISVGAQSSITVTNTNDNGPGSLREALRQVANEGEINFDLVYPDSIVIDSQLVIQGSVSINGPGKDSLIISGNNKCRVMYHRQPSMFTIIIAGLTITKGFARYDSNISSLGSNGAGLYFDNCNLILENMNIIDNQAEHVGGGLCFSGDSLKLKYVNISKNHARDEGGGIFAEGLSNFEISNTFICDNSAENYGAISSDVPYEPNSTIIIANSTIAGNSGKLGEAFHTRVPHSPKLEFNIINSIFWNEGNEIYISFLDGSTIYPPEINIVHSCIQKEQIFNDSKARINSLEGNIDIDPMIVQQSNGIYSLDENSPCIDAGIADYNFGGSIIHLNPDEYIGSAPDIGAYEYDPTTSSNEEHYISKDFTLHQNFPNPFNPTTTIEYEVPYSAGKQGRNDYVRLVVYDILGREIITLVNKNKKPGNYQQIWDASDETSGIYFYKLCMGDYKEIKKMVLLK